MDRALGSLETGAAKRGVPGWAWALAVPLAVVALLVTPNFLLARTRGHYSACVSNLKNMATAVEMYASDFEGAYPASLDLLLRGNYLKALPTCPATGRANYGYEARNGKSANFTLNCAGDNHHRIFQTRPGSSANLPCYSARQGLVLPF